MNIIRFIEEALEEDVKTGDHTSLACIAEGTQSKARLLVKEAGILAGVDLAHMVFEQVDPKADDGNIIAGWHSHKTRRCGFYRQR